MGKPQVVSDQNFETEVIKSDTPVLVDFWAAWCGPCKTMAPQFESAARQLPEVRFVKVDSDAASVASKQYGIRSIPTLVLFHRGREVDRLSGVVLAHDLVAWVTRNLQQRAV